MSAQVKGLVSIVLTTLNAERFLQEAIESCLRQTYKEIELIVVDGGSTDRTLQLAADFGDRRLRILLQENNEGRLPGAINLGLENAVGEYLTWMQADCLYVSSAIDRMVEALETDSTLGQVYSDFYEMNAAGQVIATKHLPEPEQFLDAIGDPGGVCFLIPRRVRDDVGPHDVATYPCHDFDYRMRLALKYPSRHISEPLYYWRLHDASLTGTLGVVALARRDVTIRQKLGLDSPAAARRRRAEIEMAYAFECYFAHRYGQVPGQVLAGVWRKPSYLRNLGVWSIFGRSATRTMLQLAHGGRFNRKP